MKNLLNPVFALLLCLFVPLVACGDPDEEGSGCAADSDCGGGQVCTGGTCQDRDQVCTPEATRCEDGKLVTCDAEGASEERSLCPENTACVDADGAGVCQDVVCTASEVRCVNQRQLSTCNETGTEVAVADCPEEMSCRDGACVERPCEPFEIGCLDDVTAYSCDGAGNLTELACDEGKTCMNSVCTAQSCLPGRVYCEGDVLFSCSEDGMTQTRTVCAEVPSCQEAENGCACQNGACVEL
jgi:hypothetical protein